MRYWLSYGIGAGVCIRLHIFDDAAAIQLVALLFPFSRSVGSWGDGGSELAGLSSS